jgi:excisionase family DNA binding protein
MNDLLTIDETARICHVHAATIRRHIRAGQLKSVRLGRSVRVRREDLEAYLGPTCAPAEAQLKPFSLDDPLWDLVGAFSTKPGYEWVSGDKRRALGEISMEEFNAPA